MPNIAYQKQEGTTAPPGPLWPIVLKTHLEVDMKLLRFLICSAAMFTLQGAALADTFKGWGDLRVEACKAAKDTGRLRMENKYTNGVNTLVGQKNKIKVGDCDCSEDTKGTPALRWTCIVDVDIAEERSSSSAEPPKKNEPVTEVVSRNGKGSTQIEACDDAKWLASRAVKAWNGVVVDAGSCVCGLSGLSGSLYRYECNVDTKYQRR